MTSFYRAAYERASKCMSGYDPNVSAPEELIGEVAAAILACLAKEPLAAAAKDYFRQTLNFATSTALELCGAAYRDQSLQYSACFKARIACVDAVYSILEALRGVRLSSLGVDAKGPNVARRAAHTALSQSAEPAGFPYRPLDAKIQELRILTLLPTSNPSAVIECELSHCHALEPQYYSALSYEWQSYLHPEPVQISLHGKPFSVTRNLHDALRALRHTSVKRKFWIDQVCINQDDILERNQQVAQMKSIFEEAALVFMWLGPDSEDSDLAMKLFIRIEAFAAEEKSDAPHSETAKERFTKKLDPNKTEKGEQLSSQQMRKLVRSLKLFFERSYWHRLWIVQEAILPQAAMICCGNQGVSWDVLANTVAFEKVEFLAPVAYLQYLTLAQIKSAQKWVKTLADMWLRRQSGQSISILQGLLVGRQRDTSVAHDYIYGIQGFAHQLPIETDYRKPVFTVYRDLAREMILKSGRIDILTACKGYDPDEPPWEDLNILSLREDLEGSDLLELNATQEQFAISLINTIHKNWPIKARPEREGKLARTETEREDMEREMEWAETLGLSVLPSWVPNWAYKVSELERYIQLDLYTSSNFSASGESIAHPQFSADGRVMSLQGIMFDQIAFVSDKMQLHYNDDGHLHAGSEGLDAWNNLRAKEWNTWYTHYCTKGKNPYGDRNEQMNAFRTNAVAGSRKMTAIADGSNWFEHLFDAEMDWGDAVQPDSEQKKIAVEAMKQDPDGLMPKVGLFADAVVAGQEHRFFITKQGYMGRAAPVATEGDAVCILLGGKVPFVLRKHELGYFLLGEAYLEGCMHGEAVKSATAGSERLQEFNLI